MEQRAVIRFVTLKGIKATAIQAELESVYGPEALARETVKKWRKCFQEGRIEFIDDPRRERPVTQDLAQAVQSMFTEQLVMWCKFLCRHLRIGKATCLRILHND
jgi:transposase